MEIKRDLDPEAGMVELVPQEIGRVVLNLLSNAFDAVHTRQEQVGATVSVSTLRKRQGDGPGISHELEDKVFEPFFTTKPTGQGNTGLSLSMAYDIITQGRGETLTIEPNEGNGATFVITLPDEAKTAGK